MRTLALYAWVLTGLLASCSYECNASNCADGCCGANGVCYVGGGDPYCGLKGAACQDCGAQGLLCNSAGTCEKRCDRNASCSDEEDCCPLFTCFQQKCVYCLDVGSICEHGPNCCGYNGTPTGRQCRPSGINAICK
ncbi:MAG: hypothetical protein QM765_24930 [Myxococcales bacterium]